MDIIPRTSLILLFLYNKIFLNSYTRNVIESPDITISLCLFVNLMSEWLFVYFPKAIPFFKIIIIKHRGN